MVIFTSILLLILGFVMLVKGADWFVDGAAGTAAKLHVSELIIGLTIVAFGTSAPELAVSVSSAIKGSADLTVGNVIGSNIMNILLILGLAAVFTPLPVHKNLRRIDIPFLLVVSVVYLCMGAFDNEIGRANGIILVALLLGYTAFLIITSMRESKQSLMGGMSEFASENDDDDEPATRFGKWYEKMKENTWFLIVITLVGLVLVVVGADIAVNAATTIAKEFGVSERIIGLTVVAIGTSLPELVTSVTAAIKGKTDIAVGNIVGSNLFNMLMVCGISSIIVALPFSSAFVIDASIALGAAALLAVLGYLPGNKIKRWGGVIMLVGLAGYFVYLFLA